MYTCIVSHQTINLLHCFCHIDLPSTAAYCARWTPFLVQRQWHQSTKGICKQIYSTTHLVFISTIGNRAFPVTSPKSRGLWNTVPHNVTSAPSLTV